MEPTPWLNANFKDPLFISEAAAAMAAAKQEALLLGGIRAEGDDERSNGSRVTRVEAIASGSDARALVYTSTPRSPAGRASPSCSRRRTCGTRCGKTGSTYTLGCGGRAASTRRWSRAGSQVASKP